MCGIAGLISIDSRKDTYDIIKSMTDIITHRGPDDNGFYVDENVALGMRRLSIIDLPGGHQPVFNEDKSLLIVFNGEIYNFREIRSELSGKGHRFDTNSDTEVIIHAYEEYGERCLERLNGMFAFAIWDISNKELFIARDRVGVKPLNYYKDDKVFIFGSEIKSILASGFVNRKMDYTALNMYLSFYYIPSPHTIYNNIYRLQPGHFMKVNCKGEVKIEKYWDVKLDDRVYRLPFEEHKKNIRQILNDSVEKRMVSDVPLGAFLSGGIDSSIIVGLMSGLSSKPVETFNIAFKDYKVYDESDMAKKVALFNKCSHHEFFLKYNDLLEVLPEIIWDIEEPFADSSSIPTYYVSRETKKYVTVALSGDGGDELFGGYSKYTWEYWQKVYERIPAFLRSKVIERVIEKLPSGRGNVFKELVRKTKKLIYSFSDMPMARHYNLMLNFCDEARKEMFKDEEQYIEDVSRQIVSCFYLSHEGADNLFNMSYTDLKVALPDDMLTKVDKMSMLNSLEVRSPFLDYRLVEYAFNIPSEYKLKGKNGKYILKDTFADLLPSEILNRGKSGFGIPVGEWFKTSMREILLDVLSKKNIDEIGLFNYKAVEGLIKNHMSEKSDCSNQLWSLFVFHLWHDMYIKQKKVSFN